MLLSYRNQSIDFLCKSMGWFLYDNSLRHERVNVSLEYFPVYDDIRINQEFLSKSKNIFSNSNIVKGSE